MQNQKRIIIILESKIKLFAIRFLNFINHLISFNYKNVYFGFLFAVFVSATTMGFFSIFTTNEESSIPFPIPEVSVDSLGKASAGIEIPLPPATAGLKPMISLNYNSGAGNGLVGMGWELSAIETIVRDPNYGVQLNVNDHYLSSNVGPLSYLASNAPYFFSKKESFHRFEPVYDGSCTGGPCGWIEKLPDGITYFYGVADSSGDDFNSKIKAEGTNVVKIWALNRVRDRHGNGYDIHYLPVSTTTQYSPVPYQITYNQGAVLVEFEYENRTDSISNFALGGRFRLGTRLSGIQVNFQGSMIDEWDLDYTYGTAQQSYLTRINRDNYEPLNLSYTTGNLSFGTGVTHSSKSFSGSDFNAYYKNSDNSSCSGALTACLSVLVDVSPWAKIICLLTVSEQRMNCDRGIEKNFTAFVDVTGDERPDFVRLSPAGYQVTDPMFPPTNILSHALAKIVVNPTTASGSSIQVGSGTFESPSFRFTEATKILPADINGDGRMDFYIVEDYDLNLKLAISTGSGFTFVESNIPTYMPRPDKQRWFYLKPDQNIYHFTSDMNGDGRADFIQNVSGNLVVYFSNGNSVSTGSSRVLSPAVYGNFGQSGQTFIDMDGNGIGDFVRFNNIDNVGTRELRYTLFDENNNALVRNFKTVGNNGQDGNAFFVDINGDALLDFISVLPSGDLSVFLFDGKNFATTPYQVDMNGVHPIEDSTQYMAPITSNPYLLDIRRDGGPLDKLFETDLRSGREEITIYLHDNSSQFTESIPVVAHLPDTVYTGDAPSSYYDIDQDGQPETIYIHFFYDGIGQLQMALRIHYTSDNYDYEHVINGNDLYLSSSISEQPDYPALTNSMYNSWRLSKTFAEVNGDGRADFVWFDGSTIRISYGVQNGDRVTYNSNGDTQIAASSFYTALDLNRDGKADLIGLDSAKNEISKIENFIVVNSDTAVSMTGVIHFYSKAFPEPIGLLKTIDNGIGEKTKTITYLNSFESPNAIAAASAYPIVPYDSHDVLARSVISSYGNNETSITCFNYLNHRYFSGSKDVRRNLGFEKITSHTSLNYAPLNCTDPNPLRTNEKYAIQNGTFETDGIVFRNTEYYLGTILSNERTMFSSVTSPYGNKYAQLNQSIQDSYQAGVLLTTKTSDYSYGEQYGNPTQITETIGSNTTTTQIVYLNDPTNWVLGNPMLQRKTSNGLLVQDRVLTYYSNSDISSIQDFPGKPEYAVQSFVAYDSFGNPLSIRDANNNLMSFQYDTVVNKFPIQITNALGQTVLKEYDLSKGLETKITDPNGAITLQNYDKFGRPNEVILPGESSWSQRIIYENTGRPGQTIQRLVNDSQNGELVSKEFYDTLGRSIRKETPADGGRILVSTSEYNPDGSLKRKSKPYIDGFDSIYFMDYTYNGPDGRLSQVNHPDGKIERIADTGFVKTVTIEAGGTEIHRERVTLNDLGQTISKDIQGTQSFSYSYDPAGRISQITDPASDTTNFYYDLFGRKIRQTDQNSGTILYSYDANGNLTQTMDARGIALNYTYDSSNRIIAVSGPHPDSSVIYEYDTAPNGKGKVSRVQDITGQTSFEYDIRGRTVKSTKQIEDLTFVEKAVFDSVDRIQDYTYPDGSIVHNRYSKSGYLTGVSMDVPDHGSYGYPIVSYEGPSLSASGEVQILRRMGNGVQTAITVDPIFKRVKEYKTILPNAFEQESIAYTYDPAGNISQITDHNRPDRTQTFQYDGFNRVVEATGKFGTEVYQYSSNGNLTRKGSSTFQYANSNHRQAITSMNSPSTGTLTYSYDPAGNMITRKGDSLSYNDMGKLATYQSGSLGNTINSYDYSGSRVKRAEDVKGTALFQVNGLYEVLRTPGNGDTHTLYVKGASGETVAQFSRNDANLISAVENPNWIQITQSKFQEMKDKTTSGLLSLLIGIANHPDDFNKSLFMTALIVCLGLPILIIGTKIQNSKPRWTVTFVPILLLSFGSFSGGCAGLLPGGESGTPPWAIFAAGIPATVPSINSPSGGGGSGGSGGMTVSGMYFYHPNHLGSISMLTDGGGNPISGGEMPGSSHVSYKPYGEILRTDSAGPDIFRYKYTGQEEESYTGLYNYGARFYDPELGRFIQADTVASGNNQSGMNRYMYVEGSPTNFVDPSGHNKYIHMFNQIVRHIVGADNKEMISNIKKDIINAMSDSDNPIYSLAAKSYVKAQNKKAIREAKRQQLIATGAAVVIAIASFGIGSALVGASYTVAGLAFGVIGLTAAGFAVGSTAGYLIGGTLGSAIKGRGNGGWDDRSALQGAYIGGLIGAAVGYGVGLNNMEKFLLAHKETFDTGVSLFGDPNKSKWFGSFEPLWDPGKIKAFNYTATGISAIMNHDSYSAIDYALATLAFMTPIKTVTYSSYSEIKNQINSYDRLIYNPRKKQKLSY